MTLSSVPMSETLKEGLSLSPSVHCTRHALASYERDHSERPGVEHFINRAFSLRHGATIRSFMPTLLSLEGRDRRICGVVGLRSAASESLFLERYLSAPIERVLGARAGVEIDRARIVEVGNLASVRCRAAFHLAAMLPRVLLERGHRWVVFTATHAVRGMLAQFDAPVIELGCASVERAAGSGDDWGRYYDNDPRVLAGFLPDGLALSFARSRRIQCPAE